MPPESAAVIEPNPTIIESHPAEPPKEIGKLGSRPQTSKFGDKFRAEFAKLNPETGEPKSEVVEPTKEEPKTEPAKEPPKEAQPPAPTDDTKRVAKPESPLDVVLEKGKPAEKPEITPDTLKELDEIEKPTADHWKKAREVRKALYEQVESLKSSPPKSDPALTTKIQELEATLQDREQRLKAAGAEYSPDYQKLVQEHQNITGKIATRMKSFGGDADLLVEALSMPYGKIRATQIEEALAGLDAGKQARVQTLIEELEGQGEKIADFRRDLPARYEEMQAKNEQAVREQQAQILKQLETEFIKIVEKIPDSTITMRRVPDDVPDGTNWNKELDDANVVALRVLKPDGADFNESAVIALKGARYDSLEKRYLALHSDHVELKKKMAQYDSSGPDFKGGSKPKDATPKGPKGARGFHETMNAIRRGEMGD